MIDPVRTIEKPRPLRAEARKKARPALFAAAFIAAAADVARPAT